VHAAHWDTRHRLPQQPRRKRKANSVVALLASLTQANNVQIVERLVLYGVDITHSNFLSRPAILRIAHFAAKAHAGSVRKTGTPYVEHCIATAIIVEQMVLHLFDADDWSDSRCVGASPPWTLRRFVRCKRAVGRLSRQPLC
jgi:(p)ppGpp synthase/HD superfamily hydrolase